MSPRKNDRLTYGILKGGKPQVINGIKVTKGQQKSEKRSKEAVGTKLVTSTGVTKPTKAEKNGVWTF